MPDNDFDFEPFPKSDKPRRRRPSTRLLGDLAAMAVLGGLVWTGLTQRPGTSPWPVGPPWRGMPGPVRPFTTTRPPATFDSRFIRPAPSGIDERMIVAAPPGIDEAMLVAPGRLRSAPMALPAPARPWRTTPVPPPYVPPYRYQPYVTPGPIDPRWGPR